MTSCFVKRYYIDVPYINESIFRTYPFEWFSCVDCQKNYDESISWYIDSNKITGNPFSTSEYASKGFLLKGHNTLKFLGYENLMSKEFYKENVQGLIDSLLIKENQEIDSLNYYSMFLYRREIQGTRQTVIEIIKEIKLIFQGVEVILNSDLVNDTIVQLVQLDSKLKSENGLDKKQILIEIFDYLISVEQYHLAYQIMNRPVDFSTYDISKDSLLLTFPIDTVKEFRYSDTTIRLGNFDKKGNWTDTYLWWKDYPGP